jgi:large subunit ribosomal protein L18
MLPKMIEKKRRRLKRNIHIRKAISGTVERPRMTITRSNRHLSMQVIDDTWCDSKEYIIKGELVKNRIVGHTLISISTMEKDLRNIKPTVEGAYQLGELMGRRLLEKNITAIIFDRNGYLYHGVIKALADGVRKVGIQF